MYAEFFGLTESPFSLTPDTAFYYNNASHQEALSTLLVALPFDVLEWNAESDRVFSALARFAEGKGIASRTVLLTGVVTEGARTALEQRGFQVLARYLFRT